jgi:uncharacterized protein YhaN
MRIERLDLTAYGCMTNVTLDLAATGRNMVAIYGPNEAGKSTVLNAIRDWLFGFDKALEKVAFLHTNSAKLRVGGVISDGTDSLAAIRRKGKKDTLLAEDGRTPLSEGAFDRFVRTITKEQFVSSFGLSLERLKTGGQELAKGEGELGAALFTAASPIANLQRQRAEIARRKESLFAARASKATINADLKVYIDSKKEWEDKLVSAADAAQCDADVKVKQQALEGIKERELMLRKERRNRERLTQARSLVLKFDEWNRKRMPYQMIPLLRKSFAADYSRALSEFRQAETRLKGIDEELRRQETELAEIVVDDRILAVAETVGRMNGRQQSIADDKHALIAVEQLLRTNLGEAKHTLRGLGLPIDDVEYFEDALRLSDLDKKRLQNLATEHVKLSESLKVAEQRLAGCEREVTEALRDTEIVPGPQQTEALELAVEESRRAGIPENRMPSLGREIAKLHSEITTELTRLGCGRSIEDIRAVPIPPFEVIEEYQRRFEKFEWEREEFRKKRRELEDERSRANLDLAKAESHGPIPRPDELSAARSHRDRGWGLIRGAWLAGNWDLDKAANFTGGPAEPTGMATAYESAVGTSDDIADRLATEADRVRTRLELELRMQSLNEQLARLQADFDLATADDSSMQKAWQSVWESSATTVQSPRQMKDWRLSWDKLLEKIVLLNDKRSELDRSEAAMAILATRIRRTLAATGENEATSAGIADVAELVQYATRALKKHERAAEERRLSEQRIAAARAGVVSAEAHRNQKLKDLAAWLCEWKTVTARLTAAGLSDLRPEQLNDVLSGINEFYEKMSFRRGREIDRKRRHSNVEQWNAELDGVAERLGEREALREVADPALLIDDWLGRVRTAEAARDRRDDRTSRREELLRDRPMHQVNRDAVQETMAGLLREAGVEAIDDLPLRIEQADRLREIDLHIETEYRNPIVELAASAGCTVREIEQLAAGAVGSDLQAETDAIEQQLAELDRLKVQAARELGESEQRQSELLNRRGGIDERERMEAALARIRHHVPEYATLVLAEAVLAKAIVRYREKHKSDLFESASRLFRQLTCERFARLDIDLDDRDCQYLVGVRPEEVLPDRVKIDGMSDGTCDQLYLALRLAHLEKHIDDHGPFPIVVDDILLAFDDASARAAIRCLADLSRKTQVLFFTHHRHLRDMAANSEFGDLIGIIDL